VSNHFNTQFVKLAPEDQQKFTLPLQKAQFLTKVTSVKATGKGGPSDVADTAKFIEENSKIVRRGRKKTIRTLIQSIRSVRARAFLDLDGRATVPRRTRAALKSETEAKAAPSSGETSFFLVNPATRTT
jgi:hypothetical protein